MLFTDQALRAVLGTTENAIEIRNEHGRCKRAISQDEALALDLDLFVGVGNRRRIRFLRLRTQRFTLNAGSRTTQRPKDSNGKYVAHPLIREHRQTGGV